MKPLIGLLIALSTTVSIAQDVKGISIGMLKDEFISAYPDSKQAGNATTDIRTVDMSVAGIRPRYGSGAMVEFNENKLVGYLFYFEAKEFDNMLAAFKEKYPELVCIDNTVKNGMGVEFTDTKCNYKNLRVNRFVGDVKTSVVAMSDAEFIRKKFDSKVKKAAGDI